MPNIKSAIKRVEVAKNNAERNKSAKSRIATYIKMCSRTARLPAIFSSRKRNEKTTR